MKTCLVAAAVATVAAMCAGVVEAAGDPADRCRKIYGHTLENIKISIMDQKKNVVEASTVYPITSGATNNSTGVTLAQAQVFVPTKIGYTVDIEWTYTSTPVKNPQTPEEARSAAVDWVGFFFFNYFIGTCVFKYPNDYFPTNKTTIDATQIDTLVNNEGTVRMTVPNQQDANINTLFTFTGWEVNITGYDSSVYKDSCGNPATRPAGVNPKQCIIPKTSTPTPGSDTISPTPTTTLTTPPSPTPTPTSQSPNPASSSTSATGTTSPSNTPTSQAQTSASNQSSQSSGSVKPTPATSTSAPTPATQSASPSHSSAGSNNRPTLMVSVVAGLLVILATCM
eukprot:comp22853_c2_seq1/m.36041 comp22853_c2_seq1/g.36041  ORF comp22853_c2_seq1/g.36041 comp22853_c2_seq1/m.36041 type:complete len:339 (-) comp22853_c2_seq1:83-1099(-)